MPEFTAPGLGRQSNRVSIDVELGPEASGVIYALGGASGGLTLFMDKGHLVYEYNMMIIERYQARTQEKLAPGQHKIEVTTTLTEKARRRPPRWSSRWTAKKWPGPRSSGRSRVLSPPVKPLTSASIWAPPCPWTTLTGPRSRLAVRLARWR